MDTTIIGTDEYGEHLYRVYISTGTAWYKVFQVYAYNESEAVDMVADHVEENEFEGLYTDFYGIADECEVGQSVDEYVEAHNLICCGSHGIYLEIASIELVK